MRSNKPENSFTRERFVHRYVHPSGLIRWRFLYQKKGQRCQKYFETLEEALAFKKEFTERANSKTCNENIFIVSFD